MRYTLLELTQSVLSSMDSDEINSINDSVESQQVVEVIKTVYDDIVSRSDIKTNSTMFNLTAVNDLDRPVLMLKPSGIDKIEWIKYNAYDVNDTTPNWETVMYLPPEQFVDMMHQTNIDDSYISTFSYTLPAGYTIDLNYRNDKGPTYYTSFDDVEIIFDGCDLGVDATLQSAKTLCYGMKISDFQKLDSYTPNLQPQQFGLLLNESKSLAWAELKQTVHTKAEAMARKNWMHIQKNRQQTPEGNDFNKLPNFARPR